MKNNYEPKSLQECIRYFSDPDVCVEFLAALRWPNGVMCPACESDRHSFLKTRRIWKCKECGRQFSVKLGTIFEDSPITLDKWLVAVWLVVNCKNGISSHEIARDLRITQKSAWFMLHRIRLALQDGTFNKLSKDGNPIEIDETFIGGKVRKMHKGRRIRVQRLKDSGRDDSKSIIMGMLQRGGKVKAQVIPERTRMMANEVITRFIERGAHLMTDEATIYMGLKPEYVHEIITHAEAYVRDHVSTNGIENFWSLLKRGLNGTYVSVEPFHLFRYLDEQMFRFNNKGTKTKKVGDGDRFKIALSQIAGKRLTYAEVTGKVGETSF